jgi:predicted AAA+ superfamily ATPase
MKKEKSKGSQRRWIIKLKEGMIITFDQEDKVKMPGKVIHLIPAWKWMTG